MTAVEDVFGFIAASLDADKPLKSLLVGAPAHAGFKRLTWSEYEEMFATQKFIHTRALPYVCIYCLSDILCIVDIIYVAAGSISGSNFNQIIFSLVPIRKLGLQPASMHAVTKILCYSNKYCSVLVSMLGPLIAGTHIYVCIFTYYSYSNTCIDTVVFMYMTRRWVCRLFEW